jgi:hypothetical protein
MKALVRLGLLVGAIAMFTFATVKPAHAAAPDCSTIWFQACTTQGSTVYCQSSDICPYQFQCSCVLGGPDGSLRWKCVPYPPNPDICI